MTLTDPISDALVSIKNCELVAKKEMLFRPGSKLLGSILEVMKAHNYIVDYEFIDDGKSGIYRIKLAGKINECRAVKPRYTVKKNGFEKFEKRFLPSRDIGLLIVSTPMGVMSHKEAIAKKTGGRLLAYVY
ncbi:MAG: 30S ribosomal protein S8 [Candidatus Diapherotrites archaeon]